MSAAQTPSWLLLALSALAACGEQGARPSGPQVRFSGETMGSTFEVKLFGHPASADLIDEVHQELQRFDEAFSQWREDSELLRLNAHRSTEPFAVSERFAAVLAQALRVAAATDGAFDPTVKPMSDAYRAARRGAAGELDRALLDAARERVGYRLISLVDEKVRKQRPDVLLDLDGVVAGAACDAIAARLRARGVTSFYIEITGEVLCAGEKPDGPWRVGVVDPASDVSGGQRPVRTIALKDRALCSSGDYRNATIVDGQVVHHVFDPRTGRNPEHGVVSASVLATSCAIADALGTALMVMGDEEARRRWPALRALGAEGALLLKPGEEQAWEQVEIAWPGDS